LTDNQYPLWQLLLLTANLDKSIELSCSDCFTLLDYDAGLISAGGDLGDFLALIKHHLSICSKCQAEITTMLDELRENKKLS